MTETIVPDTPLAARRPAIYLLLGAALGLVLVYVSWQVSVVSLAGPLALVIFIVRPHYGLFAYFATIVLMTEYIPVKGVPEGVFLFAEADLGGGIPPVLTLALVCMFGVHLLHKQFIERCPPAVPWVYLLAGGAICALAAVNGLHHGWPADEILIDLQRFILPILCLYLCASVLDEPRKARQMVLVLFAAASVKATILVLYYSRGRGVPVGGGKVVTYDAADLLLFIAMICLTFAVGSESGTSWRVKLAMSAAMLPMLFAIAFSYRRAAWLGLLFSMTLMVLWASRRRRRRLLTAGLAIAVLAALLALAAGVSTSERGQRPATFEERFSSIFTLRSESNTHHLLESVGVASELAESPILGLGLGSRHRLVASGWRNQPLHYVHNDWLYVWMKLGLAGLAALVWVSVKYLATISRAITSGAVQRLYEPVVLSLGAASGSWLVQSLTDSIVFFRQRTFLIVVLAVVAWSSARARREKTTRQSRDRRP